MKFNKNKPILIPGKIDTARPDRCQYCQTRKTKLLLKALCSGVTKLQWGDINPERLYSIAFSQDF